MNSAFFELKDHVFPNRDYRMYIHSAKYQPGILHHHDYYELFMVVSGNVVHHINGKCELLKKGSLVFIRPNDIHKLSIQNNSDEYINMNFSAECTRMMLEYLRDDDYVQDIHKKEMPPMILLQDADQQWVLKKMLRTAYLANEAERNQRIVMRMALIEIFSKYFILNVNNENRDMPDWLYNACKLMGKPQNFSIGISKMIEISGKTKEHLCRSMVKYKGITPMDFINDLRIDYIASMLESSDRSILNLWLDAGFQSSGYVYKLFKEKYGMTLKKYRNREKNT